MVCDGKQAERLRQSFYLRVLRAGEAVVLDEYRGDGGARGVRLDPL